MVNCKHAAPGGCREKLSKFVNHSSTFINVRSLEPPFVIETEVPTPIQAPYERSRSSSTKVSQHLLIKVRRKQKLQASNPHLLQSPCNAATQNLPLDGELQLEEWTACSAGQDDLTLRAEHSNHEYNMDLYKIHVCL